MRTTNPLKFVIPGKEEVRWELIIDTRLEDGFLEESQIIASSEEYDLGDRSFSLLRLRVGDQSHARSASWKQRAEKLGKS